MTKLSALVAAFAPSAFTVSAASAKGINLTSLQIKNGGTIAKEQVFNHFGCTDQSLSPGAKRHQ